MKAETVVVPAERFIGPFEGWEVAEQCHGALWRDFDGNQINGTDPPQHAAAVCAYGRMLQQGMTPETISEFSFWLMRNVGADITVMNDQYHATPEQFRFWWDCFMANVKGSGAVEPAPRRAP